MNKYFLLILSLVFSAAAFSQSSFYDFKIKSISGQNIDMSAFRGKKILLVNVASGSEQIAQFAQLKQLSQQYRDKDLIIICLPSDDFNKEKKNDDQIKDFFSGTDDRFLLAKKISVKGKNMSPLYEWLTQKNKNGVRDIPVAADFQKFLIGKDGRLIGYFAAKASPMLITRALN